MENIVIEGYLYQDIGPLTWNHFQDALLYSLNSDLDLPNSKLSLKAMSEKINLMSQRMNLMGLRQISVGFG